MIETIAVESKKLALKQKWDLTCHNESCTWAKYHHLVLHSDIHDVKKSAWQAWLYLLKWPNRVQGWQGGWRKRVGWEPIKFCLEWPQATEKLQLKLIHSQEEVEPFCVDGTDAVHTIKPVQGAGMKYNPPSMLVLTVPLQPWCYGTL